MKHHDESNHQLIPLTDNNGTQAVMGRDLHQFLEVGRDYTNWMKQMIGYGFTEGVDFTPDSAKTSPVGGRPRTDHILSLDMAKEISMIQRTEKGKQARQYFIECERRAKQPAPIALPDRRALAQMVIEAENRADHEAARAEAAENENAALKGGDGIRIKDFIKTYFTVPNERAFFEWFYAHGYLIDGRLTDDEDRPLRYGSSPKMRWDHMHPSYRGRKYFKLVPSGNNKWGAQRTRVIPERALDLVQLLLKASDLPTEMTREGRRAMDEYQRPGQLRIVSSNIV